MSVLDLYVAEIGNVEVSLPSLYNPHLNAVCKVILFCDKKEEGLYIALQNKINLTSNQNKSYREYIDFSKFVQVTREYALASGFRDDKNEFYDLIRFKKLEDDKMLDYILLRDFGLKWYPLIDVKELLSPIEMSFIERLNQPAVFAIPYFRYKS